MAFFLMGCGGSKMTMVEDDLGLPCKRDTRRTRSDDIKIKGENRLMMDEDPNSRSYGNHDVSKEITMSKEVPTYEVKYVNNKLIQQVTMNGVAPKSLTTMHKKNGSHCDYEDGSLISNKDSLVGSPSFREYCNDNDLKYEGREDKESGIENYDKVDKKTLTTTKEIVSDDKKTEVKNDTMLSHEHEQTKKNEPPNIERRRTTLGKVFPIHMMQFVKLTNMRRKDS